MLGTLPRVVAQTGQQQQRNCIHDELVGDSVGMSCERYIYIIHICVYVYLVLVLVLVLPHAMAVALPTAAALLPIGSDPPVALPTAVADPPVASSALHVHVREAGPQPPYRTVQGKVPSGIES
jgi:hypothetical protein